MTCFFVLNTSDTFITPINLHRTLLSVHTWTSAKVTTTTKIKEKKEGNNKEKKTAHKNKI